MKNQNSIRLNNETTYGRHDETSKRFYYGKVIQKDNTGKRLEFSVSNHLEEERSFNLGKSDIQNQIYINIRVEINQLLIINKILIYFS